MFSYAFGFYHCHWTHCPNDNEVYAQLSHMVPKWIITAENKLIENQNCEQIPK